MDRRDLEQVNRAIHPLPESAGMLHRRADTGRA